MLKGMTSRISTVLSVFVVFVATIAASSSSALCLWFLFGQSKKMPKGMVR